MSKPTLNKLKLIQKNPVKTITFNEQEIEIKQYISIQDKLIMVSDILNSAADENKFYNPGKLDLFFVLKVIDNYTNLSITDKQRENFIKLYDDVISSGFYTEVFNAIPEDEIGYVYTLMKEMEEEGFTLVLKENDDWLYSEDLAIVPISSSPDWDLDDDEEE